MSETNRTLTQRIERMTSKRVVQRRATSGGYSTATREIITFDDGSSAFIKAGHDIPNSDLATWIRREHRVYQTLTGNFLALVLGFDDDGVEPILMLQDLSAAHWPPPWQLQHIDAVLAALKQVAPQRFDEARPIRDATHLLRGWQAVANDPTPFLALGLATEGWLNAALPTLLNIDVETAVDGDALLHLDVRSDNMCLLPNRAILLDWNWVSTGNANFDIACWLPSLHAENGPAPETILPNAPEFATVMSGYFASCAGKPPNPQAPHVRVVQLQQLKTALPWAVRALGLPRQGLNLNIESAT